MSGLPIYDSYLNNQYYVFGYSFQDQHKTYIYNHIKNGGSWIVADKWPAGFQNGYIAYLDLDYRQSYWRGYFQCVWDKDDNIRKAYHNDFRTYFDECKATVQEAHEKAKQPIPIEIQKTEVSITEQSLQVSKQNKLPDITVKASQLGFFGKPKNRLCIEDFVMVDKDNPSIDSQENYQSVKCSIM